MLEQLAQAFLSERMSPVGCHFAGGYEHKGSFRHVRVGQSQIRMIQFHLIEQNQIQVDDSRAPLVDAPPPHLPLDFQSRLQHKQGGVRGFHQ